MPSDHAKRTAPGASPSDGQSPMAKAYRWSSRILAVSLEMVLPGLAGFWVDKQLGTLFLFMLIGFVLGCSTGVWHLVQMTRAKNNVSHSHNGANNE